MLNLLLGYLLLGKPAAVIEIPVLLNPLDIRDNSYVRLKLNYIQGAIL